MIPILEKTSVALLIWFFIGLPARVGMSAPNNPEPPPVPSELSPIKSRKRAFNKREPTLAISVESVLKKLREKQDIILVDVRKKSEFEKFRIPGSISVPLFAVKTKTFLKAKPLVLVNEGYGYRQVEQEVAHLRDSGFRA